MFRHQEKKEKFTSLHKRFRKYNQTLFLIQRGKNCINKMRYDDSIDLIFPFAFQVDEFP